MVSLIGFLKNSGFEEEKYIEALNVTYKTENDLRYYWDGQRFGLHISGAFFSGKDWIILAKMFDKEIASSLRILYISNTALDTFTTLNHPFLNLEVLNLSENSKLSYKILGKMPSLVELNTSFCPQLEKVELIGDFKSLEKLDVSYSEKLKEIVFPTNFSKLRFFYAQKTQLDNVLIEMGQQYFEEELRSYLKKQLTLKGLFKKYINPNRFQIIFIGNTTAGKTELRLALTNEQRKAKEPISTHGVQIFSHTITSTDFEVFGYDFGGQDYYHATHLPFYDDKTLYVLVWGNYHGWKWGTGEPDKFGLKIEEIETMEVENILYPLSYWLGSLLYTNHPIKNEIDATAPTNKEKRKLEIIQNLRSDNAIKFYLNIKELKEHPLLDIGDIVDFDIQENKKEVAKWLEKRIKERNLLAANSILKEIYDFGNKLIKGNKAFYSKDELLAELNIKKVEFETLAEYLSSNRFGYFHRELKGYFIARIDLFSKYIYQILSKALATNDQNAGYFSLNEAQERVNTTKKGKKPSNTLNQDETKFILDFLLKENVIFEVEQTQRYVAPAYLPIPKNKADLLLLESFNEPDCYWEFEGYFHSNILLQIINDNKNNLIYDANRKEYLLWKNTILIYTKSQPNENSQEYLLIELKYPNEENKLAKPRLSLSRNKAKYVNDEDFKRFFNYLKDKLGSFQGITTWIKTPYNQEEIPKYIPYNVLEECDNKQNGKFAHLVYYEHTFFNRFEFKHFKEMGKGMPSKVFVAYSKSDDEFRSELRNHLRPYEKSGEIIVFDDRDLELGSVWDAELKKQLLECDIFVCLVSINLLNTGYVVDLEIPEAIKRNKQIIPVILSPCNWQEKRYGLSDYSASSKGQAISLYYKDFALYNQSLQSLEKFERAERWTKLVEQILETKKNKI